MAAMWQCLPIGSHFRERYCLCYALHGRVTGTALRVCARTAQSMHGKSLPALCCIFSASYLTALHADLIVTHSYSLVQASRHAACRGANIRLVGAFATFMWQSGLIRAAASCTPGLASQTQYRTRYLSRAASRISSPRLNTSLNKAVCRASVRRYEGSCRAMGKPEDPSQAFHAGQAKARSALDEMSTKGEFKRTDSTYRDHVKQGTRFEPEGDCIIIVQ